ncbi:MAG: lactate utilization protein C [Deltaproteobacteria bacterium RBG_13_52_11]|nr:MAG: lactate utilization protein C [Deltaproteobacteria bacterium RBG_13_52_11]
MSKFKAYKKRLKEAARDPKISVALKRAIESYRKNVEEALKRFPHTLKLAEEVRAIKEQSIPRMEELVGQACEAIQKNKGKAFLARTPAEALEIIDGIVGTGKLIVKGKSLTGEEIDLREHLEGRGNEVYETDLGEYIIQLLGIKPMHLTAPSIHVPKEDVAHLLSRVTGKKVPPDIAIEVATVRGILRDKFIRADIGMSGANVVAADTGTLFQIENEGNIRLSTSAPPVYIALVGMEKVVPTIEDAFKVAEVTWRFAGYTVPSYVNLVSGPSKTGDIEKVITYGAHGPKEMYVIFLDAGRSRLAQDTVFREALFCLRCGGCFYECPLFAVTAGHFGDKYFGGIGAIWTAFVTGDLADAAPLTYSCLSCGRCKVRCPVEIDAPQMCLELRKRIAEGS